MVNQTYLWLDWWHVSRPNMAFAVQWALNFHWLAFCWNEHFIFQHYRVSDVPTSHVLNAGFLYIYFFKLLSGQFTHVDVAQLVEHRTGTLQTQVRFPDAARDFSPGVTFRCKLSYVWPYTPARNRMLLHLCARLKSRSPCQSLVDYGNIKTISIHSRLGRVTMSQLAFLGKGNPNFPWEKSHWDSTVVKSI